jgi:hypothetical protein
MMPLTWKCHICGRERPDDKISVHSNIEILREGQNPITVNVRYCNDNPTCIEAAPNFSFFKEASKK